MFILLAVGSLIGTWAMSGTLIAMVYYGLHLLHPNYFHLTAAVMRIGIFSCLLWQRPITRFRSSRNEVRGNRPRTWERDHRGSPE
jgi:hypothetical protein